ncbi:hypothetical protein NKG05_15310 [Oerskovia sp. M15]
MGRGVRTAARAGRVAARGRSPWRLAGTADPGAPRRPRDAWVRRTALVALLAVIGLGPSVPVTARDTSVANVDMFFVVDRTGSMAAEDFEGTGERLDGVRHDITSLTGDIRAPATRSSRSTPRPAASCP